MWGERGAEWARAAAAAVAAPADWGWAVLGVEAAAAAADWEASVVVA